MTSPSCMTIYISLSWKPSRRSPILPGPTPSCCCAEGIVTTDIARCYKTVREATTALSAPLAAEDMAVQPMPDASPTKWHLAHTTWFFETFILKGTPGYRPFHPQFEYLFNSYYNTLGPQWYRPHRGLLTRPTVAETLEYRVHVDAAMAR